MGCNGRGMRGPPEEQAGQWMTRSDEAWDAIGLSLWPGSVCKIKKLAKPPTRVCVCGGPSFLKKDLKPQRMERGLRLCPYTTPIHRHTATCIHGLSAGVSGGAEKAARTQNGGNFRKQRDWTKISYSIFFFQRHKFE